MAQTVRHKTSSGVEVEFPAWKQMTQQVTTRNPDVIAPVKGVPVRVTNSGVDSIPTQTAMRTSPTTTSGVRIIQPGQSIASSMAQPVVVAKAETVKKEPERKTTTVTAKKKQVPVKRNAPAVVTTLGDEPAQRTVPKRVRSNEVPRGIANNTGIEVESEGFPVVIDTNTRRLDITPTAQAQQAIPLSMKGTNIARLGRTAQEDTRQGLDIPDKGGFHRMWSSPADQTEMLRQANQPERVPFQQLVNRLAVENRPVIDETEDPKNGGVSVAATITPNKEEVTVADQNGNAQQITQPVTSGIGRALSGLGDWLHEDSSGDPKDYWRHKYTDGKHIPTEWLRRAGEAEAKMYGVGDSGMRDARQANLLRQSLNELNKRYTMRQLGNVGDIKGNRENYIRQFNDLNSQLQALTGTGYTMLNNSNDPALNARVGKELDGVAPMIERYNSFVSPSTSDEQRLLMAQNYMRQLSGDKGALTNYDIARFNFAAMPPHMHEEYRNSIKNMLNAIRAAAASSRDPQLNVGYNNLIRTLTNAVQDNNALGGAKGIQQGINEVMSSLPATNEHLQALKLMLDTWNQSLGNYAVADKTGLAQRMREDIDIKHNLFRSWAYQNAVEGTEDFIEHQLKALDKSSVQPTGNVQTPHLLPLNPPAIRPTEQPDKIEWKRMTLKDGRVVELKHVNGTATREAREVAKR